MSQTQLRQASIQSQVQAQARATAQRAAEQFRQSQTPEQQQQAIQDNRYADLERAARMALSGKGEEGGMTAQQEKYYQAILWGDTSKFSGEEKKILDDLYRNRPKDKATAEMAFAPTISEKLNYEYEALRGGLGKEEQKRFIESLAPPKPDTLTAYIGNKEYRNVPREDVQRALTGDKEAIKRITSAEGKPYIPNPNIKVNIVNQNLPKISTKQGPNIDKFGRTEVRDTSGKLVGYESIGGQTIKVEEGSFAQRIDEAKRRQAETNKLISSETKRYEDLGYNKTDASKLAKSSIYAGGITYTPKGAKDILTPKERFLFGITGMSMKEAKKAEASALKKYNVTTNVRETEYYNKSKAAGYFTGGSELEVKPVKKEPFSIFGIKIPMPNVISNWERDTSQNLTQSHEFAHKLDKEGKLNATFSFKDASGGINETYYKERYGKDYEKLIEGEYKAKAYENYISNPEAFAKKFPEEAKIFSSAIGYTKPKTIFETIGEFGSLIKTVVTGTREASRQVGELKSDLLKAGDTITQGELSRVNKGVNEVIDYGIDKSKKTLWNTIFSGGITGNVVSANMVEPTREEGTIYKKQIETFKGVPVYQTYTVEGGKERIATQSEKAYLREQTNVLTKPEERKKYNLFTSPISGENLNILQKDLQTKRDISYTKSARGIPQAGEQFLIGAGTSLVGTGMFVKNIVTQPVQTVVGTGKAIVQTGKKIVTGEGLPEIGRVIRQEPAFAFGYAAGEVATAYVGKGIPKTKVTSLQRATEMNRQLEKGQALNLKELQKRQDIVTRSNIELGIKSKPATYDVDKGIIKEYPSLEFGKGKIKLGTEKTNLNKQVKDISKSTEVIFSLTPYELTYASGKLPENLFGKTPSGTSFVGRLAVQKGKNVNIVGVSGTTKITGGAVTNLEAFASSKGANKYIILQSYKPLGKRGAVGRSGEMYLGTGRYAIKAEPIGAKGKAKVEVREIPQPKYLSPQDLERLSQQYLGKKTFGKGSPLKTQIIDYKETVTDIIPFKKVDITSDIITIQKGNIIKKDIYGTTINIPTRLPEDKGTIISLVKKKSKPQQSGNQQTQQLTQQEFKQVLEKVTIPRKITIPKVQTIKPKPIESNYPTYVGGTSLGTALGTFGQTSYVEPVILTIPKLPTLSITGNVVNENIINTRLKADVNVDLLTIQKNELLTNQKELLLTKQLPKLKTNLDYLSLLKTEQVSKLKEELLTKQTQSQLQKTEQLQKLKTKLLTKQISKQKTRETKVPKPKIIKITTPNLIGNKPTAKETLGRELFEVYIGKKGKERKIAEEFELTRAGLELKKGLKLGLEAGGTIISKKTGRRIGYGEVADILGKEFRPSVSGERIIQRKEKVGLFGSRLGSMSERRLIQKSRKGWF